MQVTITHWLPIVTLCPVNNLPDLIYIELGFECKTLAEVPELYATRKKLRQLVSGQKSFMEEIAQLVLSNFPNASKVVVRLAFNRHTVVITT